MVNFEDVPPFMISILLQQFNFEDFANAFRIWKNGKSHLTQAHVLEEIDLCKFFKVGEWNSQFEPFMNYASNLGVHDALFYLPAWHLARKTGEKDDAFFILHSLSEEGHFKSKLSYHFFKILYGEHEADHSINKLVELIQEYCGDAFVRKWIMDMHVLKRGWEHINHDYKSVPTICSSAEKGYEEHFNSLSWPRRIDDIESIKCARCKVSLTMYDYCNNNYDF
ncbi:hypothetical protein POM88_000931 [Heracleum sosnowskyi]|uniref:Uncharacterized protein n=1 Tax=Heracleum sosnowskyi TaxID=360622 RepID=A0AAD8NA84_9APIA|nr:hypothetical protein POM88_000931 [Heracleum sosnowskyi]